MFPKEAFIWCVISEGKVGGAVREGLAMAQQHMQEKAAGINHRGTEHLNSRPIAGDAKGVFHIAKVTIA
jgi:hypothetical protein